MSEIPSRTQTPWEETDEEVRERLQRAQSTQTEWVTTLAGLALATTALIVLLLER